MAYTEVLLPRWPTVDYITSYTIFRGLIQRPLKISFMNKYEWATDAAFMSLDLRRVLPIGFRKQDEADEKILSETAMIVSELREFGALPDEDALDNLAKMLTRDNKDGYLSKSQLYATPWISRQAYRFGFDPAEVVCRMADVIDVYLEATRQKAEQGGKMSLNVRERAARSKAMALLPEGPARTHCGPLTVSRLIRDMHFLGYSDESEMCEHVRWFVEIHDRAKERQLAADEQARTGSFEKFRLSGQTKVGVWVDSDDPYLMSSLAAMHDLVAMRSSRGNVIVMSKSFDLSGVARELIQREPKRWHYTGGLRNILSNGTESVEVPPTNLSRMAIEACIALCIIELTEALARR